MTLLGCLLSIALLTTPAQLAAEPAPAPADVLLDAPLEAGPHAVGFRQQWILDHGRRYTTAFDDGATYGARKAPRPLLLQVWYPAVAPADDAPGMTHGAYFDIGTDDPDLSPFANALSAYAREVAARQLLGAAEVDFDAQQAAAFQRALDSDAGCRLDAPPLRQRFPLVVHHSGAGSSYEDNAAFCVYLASHGYVVVASAFQDAAGESFNVDGEQGSARDIDVLVGQAATWPNVDWQRVGLVGHSAGAQALLRYGARPNTVHDALVLLDSTQDYYSTSVPLFESLVADVRAGLDNLDEPMLVASGPEALYELVDELTASDRLYLALAHVDHDEFIAQGLQRLALLDDLGRLDAAESARAPRAAAGYRALCEAVLLFLDAQLEGDFRPLLTRARDWAEAPLGGERPRLSVVPAGVSGPAPYDPADDAPPTPRQFRGFVDEHGVEATCEALRRFADARPLSPLYTNNMPLGSLLYGLVEDGRVDDARALYACVQPYRPTLLGLYDFMADLAEMVGRPDRALRTLRVAATLDPDDEALAARLAGLLEAEAASDAAGADSDGDGDG